MGVCPRMFPFGSNKKSQSTSSSFAEFYMNLTVAPTAKQQFVRSILVMAYISSSLPVGFFILLFLPRIFLHIGVTALILSWSGSLFYLFFRIKSKAEGLRVIYSSTIIASDMIAEQIPIYGFYPVIVPEKPLNDFDLADQSFLESAVAGTVFMLKDLLAKKRHERLMMKYEQEGEEGVDNEENS